MKPCACKDCSKKDCQKEARSKARSEAKRLFYLALAKKGKR